MVTRTLDALFVGLTAVLVFIPSSSLQADPPQPTPSVHDIGTAGSTLGWAEHTRA